MANERMTVLLKLWGPAILGTPLAYPSVIDSNRSKYIDFLNASLQKRLSQLLPELGITIGKEHDPETLGQSIVEILRTFPDTNCGFYPKGIVATQSLTCAGATMLASHILSSHGIEHFYARPISHSVILLPVNHAWWWLDSRNGVFETVQVLIKNYGEFKTATISSPNTSIDYRFAFLLPPAHIITQIFSNMEALKQSNNNSLDVQQMLNQDGYWLNQIDFNEINLELFPARFAFMQESEDYWAEKKRLSTT